MNPAAMKRAQAAVYYTVLALLALRLFVPAAAVGFLPAGIRDFRNSGLPEWSRWALAAPEMVGAVLLVVPATFWWGAVILVLDLGGAIGAHAWLHAPAGRLWLWLALLTLLAGCRKTALAGPCR